MAKTKKSKGSNNKKKYENIESSSGSEVDFDENEPFKDDEIESFNKESDKILLNKIHSKNYASSSEDEVLPFDDDDDDDDEEDDDENNMKNVNYDDDEVDFNEITKKSWGQKKSAYYSGNHIKNDEDAKLEEEEAQFMQNKIMQQLDLSDFDLDSFKTWKKTGESNNENELEKVVKNLDKMKKSEKLEFLKSESPEIFELIREFKEKVKELQEVDLPLFNLFESNKLERNSNASTYVLNKMRLNIMYCCHLCFYFSLKAQKIDVDNHPIISNILQFKHLCKQTNVIDNKLEKEIQYILRTIKSGKKIETLRSKKILSAERRPIELEDNISEESEINEEEGDESNTKRPINYQIEKNKGLTPKRNKLYRNPRVRHREKYRKALIKRKSIVPKVRTEMKRYSGETTGIRTNVVRGTKLK